MSAAALLAALRPAVRAVMAQFGETVTIVVPVELRRADNSVARSWGALANAPTKGVVDTPSVEKARRTWGADVAVACSLLVEAPAGVQLLPGLGVTILTGPRAGQRFIVPDRGVKAEDLGGVATLALVETSDPLAVEP